MFRECGFLDLGIINVYGVWACRPWFNQCLGSVRLVDLGVIMSRGQDEINMLVDYVKGAG